MPPYTERDLLSGMRDQAASHSAAELLVRNGDVNWDGSVSLDQHLSMMEASSGHPPPRPARLQRSAAASLLLQVAAMLQRQTAADLRGAAGWWRRMAAARSLPQAAAGTRRRLSSAAGPPARLVAGSDARGRRPRPALRGLPLSHHGRSRGPTWPVTSTPSYPRLLRVRGRRDRGRLRNAVTARALP